MTFRWRPEDCARAVAGRARTGRWATAPRWAPVKWVPLSRVLPRPPRATDTPEEVPALAPTRQITTSAWMLPATVRETTAVQFTKNR